MTLAPCPDQKVGRRSRATVDLDEGIVTASFKRVA